MAARFLTLSLLTLAGSVQLLGGAVCPRSRQATHAPVHDLLRFAAQPSGAAIKVAGAHLEPSQFADDATPVCRDCLTGEDAEEITSSGRRLDAQRVPGDERDGPAGVCQVAAKRSPSTSNSHPLIYRLCTLLI